MRASQSALGCTEFLGETNMAKKVGSFPVETRRGGRSFKYPWAEWLDGSVWELTRGIDFQVEVDSLLPQVYTQAKNRGLTAHTQTSYGFGAEPDKVYLQAVKAE